MKEIALTIDGKQVKGKEGDIGPKLSPEMEEILWKIIGKDFGEA